MSPSRSADEVAAEIRRRREELAAAVASMQHGVRGELGDLRALAQKQLPKVGAAVAVLVVTRVLLGLRSRRRGPNVLFRLGPFEIVERR